MQRRTTELAHVAERLRQQIAERQQRDATIRAQAAASRSMALLEMAHDAIIVRDVDDHIIAWNQGAESLYGWSRGEAVGQVSHGFLRTIFPDSLGEVEEALLRHGYWEGGSGPRPA